MDKDVALRKAEELFDWVRSMAEIYSHFDLDFDFDSWVRESFPIVASNAGWSEELIEEVLEERLLRS